MKILGETAPQPFGLQLVRFRILGKPYSSWRSIMAETGESDTMFLMGLQALHGIAIDKTADPMLFCSQDTHQMQELAESGVENPTMLQIMLTSKAYALSEEDCKTRIEAILRGEPKEPTFNS